MIYQVLISSLILIIHAKLYCQNEGRPILTRTRTPPYRLTHQCLCPFDFYGGQCGWHRQVFCIVTSTSANNINIPAKIVQLQFTMQCFLKHLEDGTNEGGKKINNYQNLPLSSNDVKQEQEQQNYYIDDQYEIIWANDTSLFNHKGEVILPPNSTQTPEQYLASFSPYQFNYSKTFFGYPTSNSQFNYRFEVIRYLNKTQILHISNITFSTARQNRAQTNIIGSFNLGFKSQWEEYGVIRLQMLLQQFYGEQEARVFHKVGMNSGKWRIFSQYQPTPEVKFYGNGISIAIWMILATVVMTLLIIGSRLAIRLYDAYRKDKNRKRIMQQQ